MDAKWSEIVATRMTNDELNDRYAAACELAALADELENVNLEDLDN